MRKQIEEEVTYVDFVYSTLKYAKEQIDSLIKEYSEDAKIKESRYDYSDSTHLGVFVYRDETDAEMEYREKLEAKYKREQEERDAREFERLKQKFNK